MTDDEVRRTAKDLREVFGSTAKAVEQAQRHAREYPEGHTLRSYWTRVRDELIRHAEEDPRR